jgi:hypothetical protein
MDQVGDKSETPCHIASLYCKISTFSATITGQFNLPSVAPDAKSAMALRKEH